MKGCGFEDVLLECEIFHIQQVFSGSHYVRSFAGMVIIEEAIIRLRLRFHLCRSVPVPLLLVPDH